jgi:hypothetical protein
MCGDAAVLTGIQAFVSDGRNGISMTKFGNSGGSSRPCIEFYIKKDEIISTLSMSFNDNAVTRIQLKTDMGETFERGVKDKLDSTTIFEFSRAVPFIGLSGYEKSNKLTALGAIKFTCVPSHGVQVPLLNTA